MARLYRRGDYYWADFREEGGRQQSLRTKDRDVARARFKERLIGAADPTKNTTTVREALENFIAVASTNKADGTVHSYTYKAGHLARLLGHLRVTELTPVVVAKYYAARLDEGAATASINKESNVLRQSIRQAGGNTAVVPSFSDGYEPRERHLTHEEYALLLDELPEPRRLWLVVACYTGARLSELTGLLWEDVKLKKGLITIRGTKTRGAKRVIPIHPALHAWLAAAPRLGPRVLASWGNVGRDLKSACARLRRAGHDFDNVTPNDCRRTFASWLIEDGKANLLVVAKLLGHTSTRMLERTYGQMDLPTYQTVISALPACPLSVPRGTRTGPSRSAKVRAAESRRKWTVA